MFIYAIPTLIRFSEKGLKNAQQLKTSQLSLR